MSFIKIGSLNVPIIDTVELEGRPTSATLPTAVSNAVQASVAWELGINCGQSANGFSPDGALWTEPLLHAGVTAVQGDGGNFYVYEPTESPETGYGAWLTGQTQFIHLATTINCGNIQLTPGYTGYTTYSDTSIYRLVAVRYKYLGAQTDAEGRYGYAIFCIHWTSRIDRNGNETISTDKILSANIFFPRWNYANGWDCYYNEIPDPTPPEPVPPFDPSGPNPYSPNIDDTSDTITVPTTPVIGVTNAGFINVYNPAVNGLVGLGTVLFPNVNISTDVITAIQSVCEVIMNSNLINYVIDCHVIPVAPTVTSAAEIKVGFRDTGIYAPKVSSDYVHMTCGTLSILEYFSSFADYLTTRAKLYLPFVGFVDMLPEYWQSGTIGVEYNFNIIDGSFMAYVTSVSSKSNLNGSVIASFSGNACMHFPITGVNYANMVSGIVGAAATIATAGSWSAAMGGAASAINTFSKGGDVQQSNGYNSTSAFLSVRTPYLLIERAVPSYPSTYAHSKGYPSNIATALSNVSGFTIIEDVDLYNIPFTSGELDELRQLLSDGVYF